MDTRGSSVWYNLTFKSKQYVSPCKRDTFIVKTL